MEALGLNESLSIAYYLKEDLGQIWQQSSKAIAGTFLKDWCARARASGIRVLQTMANTLEGHRTGILNWYDFPSQPADSKASIIRSVPSREWPMDTAIMITSSPNSTLSISPSSRSSDNH